ncbi:hypothetical protein BGW80DRAFT_1466714 [Lactifluus volemus]|nr:hypothetical protein BGW80DRAFT_1466714 [Lactifluus volemus]
MISYLSLLGDTSLILQRDETRASTWEAHPSRALSSHHETSLLHILFTGHTNEPLTPAGRQIRCRQTLPILWPKHDSSSTLSHPLPPRPDTGEPLELVQWSPVNTPVAATPASRRARPYTPI